MVLDALPSFVQFFISTLLFFEFVYRFAILFVFGILNCCYVRKGFKFLKERKVLSISLFWFGGGGGVLLCEIKR